tara:strand:+ start:4737 stop:7172 length:2436 start_codon:yes stop_codon:yes gene_type:complete
MLWPMKHTTRFHAALLVAITLSAAACGSVDSGGSIRLSGATSTIPSEDPPPTTAPPTTTPTPPATTTTVATVDVSEVELTSGLIPFTACQDLLAYLRAEATERVGPYGLGQGGGFFGGPVMLERAEMGMAVPAPAMDMDDAGFAMGGFEDGPMAMGIDYSGTNVQELGIDEPDLIKTDGSRIVVVQGSELHHIDVSGAEAVLTDTLTLENHWSSDLLLSGDRLLVMASTDPPWDLYGPEGGDGAPSPLSQLVTPGQWRQLTSIIEVDLGDPANLTVANTLTLGGRYLSARVVDGAARIVTTSTPDDLPFVYPANEAGEERAEAANREAIAQTEIADWMPRYVHEAGDGTVTDGMLVKCRDVAHPVEFSGFSTLSVLTVDLAEPMGVPSSMGVLADGQTVYAGNEHLYVATNRYVEATEGPWNEPDNDYATSIHQFDATGPAATPYTASGTVPGHLLNQFSMSEHRGHLRVASTLGSPWWFQDESESLVTVLTRNEGELLQVGQVGDMGRGERIFAVRFIGDIGYVVTFRQTDPFYTLDLSDPTAPTVTGELKIAGYSGYLHPVGDGLILGIGQDATDEGRTTGAKATLFDVSDLSEPAVLDSWQASGGSSSVEWDHRAFLWWEPEHLAVMPFNDWRNDINAAVVLQIADGTIAEMGRVDHMPDPGGPTEFPCPTIDADLLGGAAVPEGLGAELALFVPEGITLMLCVADETDPEKDIYPWVDGYMCEFLNADDVAEYGMEFGLGEFGIEALDIPEGATVGACFPDNYTWMPPIERTLVIGDHLWSYSWGQVQANDLASLERLQTVRFGNSY